MISSKFENDEEPKKNNYPKVNYDNDSNNNENDFKQKKRKVIYPKDNSDSDSKEIDIKKEMMVKR